MHRLSRAYPPSNLSRVQVKSKEKEIRILMVGLDNAGKTTIVKRINGEDISTISPTLGFNIKTMRYQGYGLNIWDVGGQKTLRSYWRNYYESTDGLVWVVDSADVRRLEDCALELKKLLGEEKLAGASVLIFANKQDIPGALTEVSELSRTRICMFFWRCASLYLRECARVHLRLFIFLQLRLFLSPGMHAYRMTLQMCWI